MCLGLTSQGLARHLGGPTSAWRRNFPWQRGRAFAQFFLAIQSTWFVAKFALDVAQIWAAIEDQSQCPDSLAVALAISLARQTFFF
jgi:hypothetical protein